MKHKTLPGIFFLWTSIWMIPFSSAIAQSFIPFDSAHWNLDRAKVSKHLDKEAATGALTLLHTEFINGTIEVDIAAEAGIRAYPGIIFRKQDAGTYERIYLRPHRGGLYDDALQYAPAFNGADSWQLYGGPGNSSALDIPSGKWNHLKIVVSGDRADVYWNNEPEPVLMIGKLAHGRSAGSVELISTAPGKVFFSAFSITKTDAAMLPAVVLPEPVCGALTGWEISSPYPLIQADFNTWPEPAFLAGLKWKAVTPDPRGFVDISRHFARISSAGECIMARTTLKADKDTLVRLGFGYSDYLTIYLNQRPVFSGNSAYQSRDGSFLGMVGYNDIIFLSLKKGDNELALQLGESMGGWAFGFRHEDEACLHPSVRKDFTLKNGISFPEAIVYDEKDKVCYVANYFNEGKESISIISPDGKLLKADWITGLQRPTGMCIRGRNLYSVDRGGINVIDIQKGVVTEKISITGALMLNDVTIDMNGILYVSDTRGNKIFRISGGKPEEWLGPGILESPNALFADGDRLLVGQNGKLLSVSIADKTLATLAVFAPESNIDGIQPDGSGNYLVSDYNGTLYNVSKKGEKVLLINTITTGEQIADFCYIAPMKRIIIPTLMANSVTGYTLK